MTNEIVNQITKTEIFLFITTVVFIGLWIAKSYAVNSLKFHLQDMRENAHKFYIMYMELSNSSLDIVKRWQDCQEENKDLLKQINSKPQS